MCICINQLTLSTLAIVYCLHTLVLFWSALILHSSLASIKTAPRRLGQAFRHACPDAQILLCYSTPSSPSPYLLRLRCRSPPLLMYTRESGNLDSRTILDYPVPSYGFHFFQRGLRIHESGIPSVLGIRKPTYDSKELNFCQALPSVSYVPGYTKAASTVSDTAGTGTLPIIALQVWCLLSVSRDPCRIFSRLALSWRIAHKVAKDHGSIIVLSS
ncbi:hypothetical protein B0F90DRAFT_1815554 [Multifurca ochricompacta]|uniref:Uncharacterized protein n=1 Tax=Multifurca ochricompacta TaxID=376703 RepID=A0AAD4QQL1_9AGAM|nr:hypothetical protein B0F90DRAFT_1815554 [Multifurca ochricompacta]